MVDPTLILLRRQVEKLFADCEALYNHLAASGYAAELEVRAQLAMYLCVRVCGFVDVAVAHIYQAHIVAKAAPSVQRFASLNLGKLQNLKSQKLIQLAGGFDENWARDLDLFLVDERKDAIDSLVSNRNNIAHGRPTGVTHVRVKRYFEKAVEVVEFIEGQVA